MRLLFAGAVLLTAPLIFGQPRPGGPPPAPQRRAGPPQQQAQKEYKPEELCTVEGYVRNSSTGEALAKANVSLFSNGGGGGRGQQQLGAATDSTGKFTIRGIEPGQYRISAGRNGYVRSEQSGRRAISPGPALTLATSQKMTNIEVRLTPHGVVTGRIHDSDGEPVVRANVQLMRYHFNQQGQRELMQMNGGQTNDLGEYRIFGVPPGKYFVSVVAGDGPFWPGGGMVGDAASGIESAIATYYPGAAEPSQATAIEVPMGGAVQGIDIGVLKARTYQVSGVVVGAPAGRRQGMVALIPASGPEGMMAIQFTRPTMGNWRPDGKFTVRGVAPGSYTIVANSFDGDQRTQGTGEVQVGDRNVDNAQVVMQPSFELTGVVRLDGEGTVEFNNANLSLMPRERGGRFGGGGGGRVEADGKITLRQINAGHYDVMVNGLPENHYVKTIRVGEADALADGARILPGMQLDVVVSAKSARVTGSVTNEKGEPVGSASVVLFAPKAPPSRRLRMASVDQQGQFSLSGIAPGDYYLAALDEIESGVFWDPEFLVKHEKLIEKISLRESATESKTLKLIVTGQ